jgi:hypothetical protein
VIGSVDVIAAGSGAFGFFFFLLKRLTNNGRKLLGLGREGRF